MPKARNMPIENTVISYSAWFGYGVGHVLNDLCASMWFTYLLVFYESALRIDRGIAGATLFIGQIADGISTPIVGLLSDRGFDQSVCKYGRRKLWHLIGTICVVCSFPFVFTPCLVDIGSSQMNLLFYYSVFIIIFQFGWASTQISHLSLVPELTSNQHERTSLITLRYSFTVLSNITVYLIFWIVIRFHRNGADTVITPQDTFKFQMVAYTIIGIGLAMSVIFHMVTKEKTVECEDTENLVDFELQTRTSLIKNWRIYNVACLYMATRLFVNLIQMYIPLYVQNFLNLPSENLALIPLIIYISSFVTSIIIKHLNVEFDRKITYSMGAIIGLGSCVWIRVGNGSDYYYSNYEIYGVAIFLGFAGTITLVTSLGITADLIGNNTNNGAFVYGILSFCDKVANGSAVLVIELIGIYSKTFYRDVIFYTCGGAALFGLVAVVFITSENILQTRAYDDTIDEAPDHTSITDEQ